MTLDRNGLRPMRYAITSDGWFVAGSEAGTVAIDPSTIVEKGRLGPGQMVLVDTSAASLRNNELKAEVAARQPYAEWLHEHRIRLEAIPEEDEPLPVPADADAKTRAAATKTDPAVVARQRAFGYTAEDLRLIVTPMAGGRRSRPGRWATTRRWPSSPRSRPLTAYFRQRFAQVTNPPIDPCASARFSRWTPSSGRAATSLSRIRSRRSCCTCAASSLRRTRCRRCGRSRA